MTFVLKIELIVIAVYYAYKNSTIALEIRGFRMLTRRINSGNLQRCLSVPIAIAHFGTLKQRCKLPGYARR